MYCQRLSKAQAVARHLVHSPAQNTNTPFTAPGARGRSAHSRSYRDLSSWPKKKLHGLRSIQRSRTKTCEPQRRPWRYTGQRLGVAYKSDRDRTNRLQLSLPRTPISSPDDPIRTSIGDRRATSLGNTQLLRTGTKKMMSQRIRKTTLTERYITSAQQTSQATLLRGLRQRSHKPSLTQPARSRRMMETVTGKMSTLTRTTLTAKANSVTVAAHTSRLRKKRASSSLATTELIHSDLPHTLIATRPPKDSLTRSDRYESCTYTQDRRQRHEGPCLGRRIERQSIQTGLQQRLADVARRGREEKQRT